MEEFWETNFKDKQSMWGAKPSIFAVTSANLFIKNNVKTVLIPGFGYGRNATPFIQRNIEITGIEISETAIELAKNHLNQKIDVYHGSVADMPFDSKLYDGVFSHALVHLLDIQQRENFLRACYDQTKQNGILFFTCISKNDPSFQHGQFITKNRILTPHGIELFYYDEDAIYNEFGKVGLIEFEEVVESTHDRPKQTFWQVICRKL